MLIDRATIFVRSGRGGDGCVSFRREKFIPKGGPNGGNGGRGGDIVLVGEQSLSTLLPLTPRPHYRAQNGQPGKGSSMTGADADHLEIQVPPGTLVYDQETDELVADIRHHGERVIAAPGGKGGLGNEHFKSATNQTPREGTPGEPWVERTLRLELKLIADVGFVGLPNAGKSTFLRAVTRGRPKVADYPFTTLSPHLGIAELPGYDERRLVLADIPGLIEGAADGAGLGHDFLRHIERTSLLLHIVDLMPFDGSDPIENYTIIRGELMAYSPVLAEKDEVILLNKIDLFDDDTRSELVRSFRSHLNLGPDVALIEGSGATGAGTIEALEACWKLLARETPGGWQTDG